MGFPSQGVKAFYRNSLNDVVRYFSLYHQGRVKIYNLCDEDFRNNDSISIPIDKDTRTKYRMNVSALPISHFPIREGNPTSMKMLFYFCLDALLFLSEDDRNVIAVHCKAGRGRSGLVLSCYILFMEGCKDAYDAINLFNFRRTFDMKGLEIPS